MTTRDLSPTGINPVDQSGGIGGLVKLLSFSFVMAMIFLAGFGGSLFSAIDGFSAWITGGHSAPPDQQSKAILRALQVAAMPVALLSGLILTAVGAAAGASKLLGRQSST